MCFESLNTVDSIHPWSSDPNNKKPAFVRVFHRPQRNGLTTGLRLIAGVTES
ncbi:hypothetical protein PFL603g_05663 [Pseudomonas fluorescens]|jgi:hypothetical protein|uniref:Uncharacterized protein n=1 Tax=Pseudomonas fluorescens TaxID=294 RepID=A0A109KKM2_PSEFL|nr:hypothetical protein PFL603g_05663 [Pseudomonas fluorescens]